MSRIRSIKPEWLEDEKLGAADDAARVLSVGLICLADDHGRGRANKVWLGGQVWGYLDDSLARMGKVAKALVALAKIGYLTLYEVRGEHYYAIRNWTKHQKVTNPGKPRVPPPEDPDARVLVQQTREICESREDFGDSRNFSETLAGISTDPDHDPDQDQDPDHDQDQEHGAPTDPETSRPDAGPSLGDLESRYPTDLVTETRAACALSRRSGKLADSVWLRTLRAMAPHPTDAVERAMRTFVDRHADGEKDERYLLGIVRGELRHRVAPPAPRSSAPPVHVPPPPLSAEEKAANAVRAKALVESLAKGMEAPK